MKGDFHVTTLFFEIGFTLGRDGLVAAVSPVRCRSGEGKKNSDRTSNVFR